MEDKTGKVIARGLVHDTERVFSEQLNWVIQVLNHHPEFKGILSKQDIPAKEKQKLLEDVMKDRIDPQVFNLILMLASGGRLHLLESIQQEFERMTRERTEILSGTVESAFPLDEETMERLEARFSAIMHRKIKLALRIEPSIIGGIVVTIGDRVFDGSIRSQLNRMKEHILQD